MSKLVYSLMTSLDGYAADARGRFGWGAPEDEEVHAFANELSAGIGTYLYGRRMYETMAYWETAPTTTDQPPVLVAWARQWQATEKVVFSRTLEAPAGVRTRIERSFDPEAVRRLKERADGDLAVAGPELAAAAILGGLVDEIHPIVCPVIVGGGKRFLADGVHLDLHLIEERRFDCGVVALRYVVR